MEYLLSGNVSYETDLAVTYVYLVGRILKNGWRLRFVAEPSILPKYEHHRWKSHNLYKKPTNLYDSTLVN